MIHAIKVAIPIICTAFLAIAGLPKSLLATVATYSPNEEQPLSIVDYQISESSLSDRPGQCLSNTEKSQVIAQAYILCERWLAPYILLRRFLMPGPQMVCIDEVIDVRTGIILNRAYAPCDRRC